MRTIRHRASIALTLLAVAFGAHAQAPAEPANPKYDPKLAQSTGADEIGMRGYVLVILKTAKRVPDGPERDEMFKGHFANISRLAAEGKLVLAGPLDGVDGWRGLYVFATPDIEEARKLVATDPVVVKGEMVPELHKWYGSAALMLMPEFHDKVAKKR
ncbi:MAG: YciI family protein [Burkholderiales bacterium]